MKIFNFLLSLLILIFVLSFAFHLPLFSEYRFFLVQSGSMEPSIMVGDLILVKKQAAYFQNEAITFQNQNQRITTHRILEIKNGIFQTKGDANRVEDNDAISQGQILGKVSLVIPKIGFLVAFAKTLPGLIVLVLIPSTILIISAVL